MDYKQYVRETENIMLMQNARLLFQELAKICDFEGKEGVYISLFDPSICEQEASLSFMVGKIKNGKGEKYRKLSIEKPLRAYRTKKISSYFSRVPDKDMWGGGFFFHQEDYGIGVSGLTESQDALFGIFLLLRARMIPYHEAYLMTSKESDEVFNMFQEIRQNSNFT